MIGRPYDEGIEQEGSIMRITSATMYKYNWTVSPGYTGILGLPIFNPYRFSYNGQERMDEKAGKANHYTFGVREYDPRKAYFELPDPLAKKYPAVSPYSFAGLNPILNIDRFGLEKTTYTVIINEQTGQVLLNKTTAPDLRPERNIDFYQNWSYDWYDYSEYNVTTLSKDGKKSTYFTTTRDALRTNTLIKSETYARGKVGLGNALSSYFKTGKEKGSGGGWTLTTKDKLFPGNDSYLNRDGRGAFINVDAIKAAFGAASGASGVKSPENRLEGMQFLKDVLGVTDAVVTSPLFSDDVSSTVDKTPHDTICTNCKGDAGKGSHGYDRTIFNKEGDSIGTIKQKE